MPALFGKTVLLEHLLEVLPNLAEVQYMCTGQDMKGKYFSTCKWTA